MPIYEYESKNPKKACMRCREPFEILQGIAEAPLVACPECGGPVKRIISWCRCAVVESSEEHRSVEGRIKDYEASGMWSHAAELADKHSEKVRDKGLKMRALDDYRKAGYDTDFLSKHADLNNDDLVKSRQSGRHSKKFQM
jgi:putative FmdB family regulatory protein